MRKMYLKLLMVILLTCSALAFQHPLPSNATYVISRGYGEDSIFGGKHWATDFAVAGGTPVLAVEAGQVTQVWRSKESGNNIRIRHHSGYESAYSHLRDNTTIVKVGYWVQAGQQIAEVGTTGTMSTGDHLHLAMWDSRGNRVDPLEHIKSQPYSLNSSSPYYYGTKSISIDEIIEDADRLYQYIKYGR